MIIDVIVRALGAQPVAAVAMDKANGLVYVAKRESLQRVELGLTEPVGVPASDVFEFDQTVYERLCRGEIGWDAARPASLRLK